MKIKTLIALMLLVPLAIGSVAYAGDPLPPDLEAPPTEEATVYEYQEGEIQEQLDHAPDVESRAFGMYGVNWFPEKPSKFAKVKRYTEGTKTRVNTPGTYYMDISIPLYYWYDGSQKLQQVSFCGQSSKGAKTKPVKWEWWSEGSQFYSGSIAWSANENVQCVQKIYSPATLEKQNLLVRVYVKYHNTTHSFTFKKARVALHR